MTKPQRAAILSKTNGHCAYCGIELTGRFQVDHVIPRWHVDQYRERYPVDFDVNHIDNLMPSCCSCNNYKSGNPLEVFRKSIARQIEILRRDRPTFRLAERYGLIKCEPKEVVFYFEINPV